MTKTVNTRLDRLEMSSTDSDRPLLVVYQDLEDRDIYHLKSRDGDQVMTWPEIDTMYRDHVIFKVDYVDNWRSSDDHDY